MKYISLDIIKELEFEGQEWLQISTHFLLSSLTYANWKGGMYHIPEGQEKSINANWDVFLFPTTEFEKLMHITSFSVLQNVSSNWN